ncbi:MAG: methyltransferase family protein [Minisyncoccia bacterium]
MIPFAFAILAVWLVFIVYWFVSAIRAKESLRTRRWWRSFGFRLVIVVIIIILAHTSTLDNFYLFFDSYGRASWYPILGVVGILVAVGGLALAIWARTTIGRNWGMPMTLRKEPELVTSGPYARIRHPIYTAVLLMMLGSALAVGLELLLFFVFFGGYFIYSAKTEEKDMLAQFPEQYPTYKARTRGFVPFVF